MSRKEACEGSPSSRASPSWWGPRSVIIATVLVALIYPDEIVIIKDYVDEVLKSLVGGFARKHVS